MDIDLFQGKYKTKSIRLKDWDYSQSAYYFVTICVKDRKCQLASSLDGKIGLTELGEATDECWRAIPDHFLHVSLDEFVIMPNHVHGILIFNVSAGTVETQNLASSGGTFGPQSRNLGSVIRGFKIGVTKAAKKAHVDLAWQPRYYEHIIRNEYSLAKIRKYIKDNPGQWDMDSDFVE